MGLFSSPKKTADILYSDVPQEAMLHACQQIAEHLNWKELSTDKENTLSFQTPKSMHSFGELITIELGNNLGKIKSTCIRPQLTDYGKNKKNISAFMELLNSWKENWEKHGGLSAEIPPTPQIIENPNSNEEQFEYPAPQNGWTFLSLFTPREGYFITPIIVLLNIAIYLIMVISGIHFMQPDIDDMIAWGAVYKPLVVEGQNWRLFTSSFLHFGIIHLLFNMYALFFVGNIIEAMMGKFHFAIAYLLAGLFASLTSVYFNDFVVSAGASGAIFGVYGLFLVFSITKNLSETIEQSVKTSIIVFIAYNLLGGFTSSEGVDNAAHLGGLVSGVFIGFALLPALVQKNAVRPSNFIVSGLMVLLIAATYWVTNNLSSLAHVYEEKIEAFSKYEEIALQTYINIDNIPENEVLSALKEDGIVMWEMALQEINDLQNLDFPEHIQANLKLLEKYCQYRIAAFEVLYESIASDSEEMDSLFAIYNDSVVAILNILNDEE
jgi:rhomboid protease GluP